MSIEQIIDFGLGILLAAVLLYGTILSRRLARFKAARGDLETLVATLSGTVVQARNAVTELKEAGEEAEERLAARLKQVRRLTDEMDAMHASGEALAARMKTSAGRSAASACVSVKTVQAKTDGRTPSPTSLAGQIAALQAGRAA